MIYDTSLFVSFFYFFSLVSVNVLSPFLSFVFLFHMQCKVAQKTQLTVSSAFTWPLISSNTTIQKLHGFIIGNSVIAIICADLIPSEDMSNW